MNNVNRAKRKRILFFSACALLLVLVIATSSFMYTQARGNEARTTGNTIASPSATPALTRTAQEAKQPLFYDDFADMSKGWYQGSVPGYTRVIANNALTLADANHKIMPESLPSTEIFKDFKLTVTCTLIQAAVDDSVGLYVRGDSYLDHDYRVDIYPNQTYAISKELLDASKQQVQYLVAPTQTSLLRPAGEPNTVSVMMQGEQLVLELNGKFVSSVSDPDYSSGQIALFVQNSVTSGGVEASFQSIAVYPVGAPLLTPGT